MRARRLVVPVGAALVALSMAAAAHGQSIGDRIRRADGTYRFSFTAKPGVCGDGAATIYINEEGGGRQRIQIRGDSWNMSTSRYIDEWSSLCESGPVRMALTVDDGSVTSLRTYVGGNWRAGAATDLGRVGTRAAVDYLLDLAQRGGNRVGRDAIFAATLADSAEVWRGLMRIAKNNEITRDVRRNAVFWLGQEAADAATAGLKEIIDSDDDVDVREHAVFALSQRPAAESVPALIALIKRTNTDPRIKKKALFWLAQKDDPRALALFEEILNK